MVTAAESHQAAVRGLLFFTALGPPLIALGWSGWRRDRARHASAGRWTMGEARIEQAEIVERLNSSARSRKGTYVYDPCVIYNFQANGIEQRGARPFLSQKPDWTRREWGQSWLASHAPGALVPVWYDPANPGDSALERNPPRGSQMWYLFGGIGMTLAAGLFWLLL